MKTSISLALLVVIVASFVSSAESAQTKLCGMDPRLSMRDRRFIPAFHNKLRRQEQASAMMHMVWNEELARRASEQASTCEFKQSIIKDCSGRFMAQSQYLEGGGAPGVRVNWRRVFTNWWRGSRHYNHTTSTCNTGETCGQYIMMARDVHGQVGCSYMKCPLVTVGVRLPWKNVIIYVCNYRRTGHPSGTKPYKIGKPCTDCASIAVSGYVCKKNLCKECTRAKNRQCTCIPKKCSKGGVFSNRLCRCACKKGYWGDACEYPCACKNTNNFCRLLPKSYCSRPSLYNWLRRNCSETCPKVCEIVKPPPMSNC